MTSRYKDLCNEFDTAAAELDAKTKSVAHKLAQGTKKWRLSRPTIVVDGTEKPHTVTFTGSADG